MADDTLLRGGVRTLVIGALAKGGVADDARCRALADQLEEACYTAAQQAGPDSYRGHYSAAFSGLCRALPEPYGDYLEASLAAQIADERVSVQDAVAPKAYNAHQTVEPRQRCRALFYAILARDPRFNSPKDKKRRDYASRIERGCYNAAIARCAESADSYRRRWDSPMFVNVYSGRCGLVAANIDPGGSVVKQVEGGAWALDRLATKVWLPESLGAMTATELCPLAGKAERDAVTHRLKQKVDEKTSSLFACPRCHKRNHTYRQVQIGAGDEPSTFMCTCKECGENYEGFA